MVAWSSKLLTHRLFTCRLALLVCLLRVAPVGSLEDLSSRASLPERLAEYNTRRILADVQSLQAADAADAALEEPPDALASHADHHCEPFSFPSRSGDKWHVYNLKGGKTASRHTLLCAPGSLRNVTRWGSGIAEDNLLSRAQLHRAVESDGRGGAFDGFVRKLLTGEKLTIGVVGGSISAGMGSCCNTPQEVQAFQELTGSSTVGGYGRLFFDWLNATFPHPAGHRYVNGAAGGTMSSYMEICVKWHIPEDVDLVVVEYTLNDGRSGHLDAMERLIRKISQMRRAPAVVLMSTFSFVQVVEEGAERWDFQSSADARYAELAKYYSLAAVSLKSATFVEARRQAPGFALPLQLRQQANSEECSRADGDPSRCSAILAHRTAHFMTTDLIHPNQRGHNMLAQMLVFLVQRALTDALIHSQEPESEPLGAPQLPPPMLEGNYVSATRGCYIGRYLDAIVAANQGWEFVDDGKDERHQKIGLTSYKQGDRVELRFNTLLEDLTDDRLADVLDEAPSHPHATNPVAVEHSPESGGDEKHWYCYASSEIGVQGPWRTVEEASTHMRERTNEGSSRMLCEMSNKELNPDPRVIAGQDQVDAYASFWKDEADLAAMRVQCLHSQCFVGPDSTDPVTVGFGFLRSYEHMGTARVTCSGCLCRRQAYVLPDLEHRTGVTVNHNTIEVDTLWNKHQSQTVGVHLEMMPSEACIVTIENVISEGREEGKVKLNNVMITSGTGFAMPMTQDTLFGAKFESGNKGA